MVLFSVLMTIVLKFFLLELRYFVLEQEDNLLYYVNNQLTQPISCIQINNPCLKKLKWLATKDNNLIGRICCAMAVPDSMKVVTYTIEQMSLAQSHTILGQSSCNNCTRSRTDQSGSSELLLPCHSETLMIDGKTDIVSSVEWAKFFVLYSPGFICPPWP